MGRSPAVVFLFAVMVAVQGWQRQLETRPGEALTLDIYIIHIMFVESQRHQLVSGRVFFSPWFPGDARLHGKFPARKINTFDMTCTLIDPYYEQIPLLTSCK